MGTARLRGCDQARQLAARLRRRRRPGGRPRRGGGVRPRARHRAPRAGRPAESRRADRAPRRAGRHAGRPHARADRVGPGGARRTACVADAHPPRPGSRRGLARPLVVGRRTRRSGGARGRRAHPHGLSLLLRPRHRRRRPRGDRPSRRRHGTGRRTLGRPLRPGDPARRAPTRPRLCRRPRPPRGGVAPRNRALLAPGARRQRCRPPPLRIPWLPRILLVRVLALPPSPLPPPPSPLPPLARCHL
ncbi:hypothetical protein SAMN06295924_10781 [Rathayibacter rathayi NCPPB 2980 = VKM Ac-1601]|nr:hypothetical protein FB469_0452 [Rathayibacter rathayi]SOE05107.1 hypothetical protein SAMN06295924_10781 [Rathayibacter rathayi NCPPB 2980 = VKM Ac-1601]